MGAPAWRGAWQNQPLHLTGASLRFRATQRLCRRPGSLTLSSMSRLNFLSFSFICCQQFISYSVCGNIKESNNEQKVESDLLTMVSPISVDRRQRGDIGRYKLANSQRSSGNLASFTRIRSDVALDIRLRDANQSLLQSMWPPTP